MLCVMLSVPLRGCHGSSVVREEAFSAKTATSPPSPSSSPYLPHVSYPFPLTKQGVYLPPRLCNLNEFGTHIASDRPHDESHPDFFSSLSAIAELSAQIQNWEVLSGRLAMMVFASALILEALTGNSVFEKMDSQRLLECCGATFVSILIAAGFAAALQAKAHMAYKVSRGYEKLINGLVDNVIDNLLFDDEQH